MRNPVLFLVYKIIMPVFLKILVGVKFQNKEVLKKQKQYIIVANHNSHLDTMAIMSSLPVGRLYKTHPVAAADYFGKSSFKSFITKLFVNALLIKRHRGEKDRSPIDIMTEVLKKGDSLILFPEGSRGEPEKMQEFKKGVGVLLQRNREVFYIPVFIRGLGRVLPRGEKLLVPFDSYVFFGEPSLCKSNEVDEIVKEIELSIRDLGIKNEMKKEVKKQVTV